MRSREELQGDIQEIVTLAHGDTRDSFVIEAFTGLVIELLLDIREKLEDLRRCVIDVETAVEERR